MPLDSSKVPVANIKPVKLYSFKAMLEIISSGVLQNAYRNKTDV